MLHRLFNLNSIGELIGTMAIRVRSQPLSNYLTKFDEIYMFSTKVVQMVSVAIWDTKTKNVDF
jgi:hypothetical protein